jgi:hypothetical protein
LCSSLCPLSSVNECVNSITCNYFMANAYLPTS